VLWQKANQGGPRDPIHFTHCILTRERRKGKQSTSIFRISAASRQVAGMWLVCRYESFVNLPKKTTKRKPVYAAIFLFVAGATLRIFSSNCSCSKVVHGASFGPALVMLYEIIPKYCSQRRCIRCTTLRVYCVCYWPRGNGIGLLQAFIAHNEGK